MDARKREEALWSNSTKEWKHEMEMNNVPKKLLPKKGSARAGTLVVCPVIALSQWKSEIEKFTEPGTLTVGVYHGPNRSSELPSDMIQKYDVVLTTYQGKRDGLFVLNLLSCWMSDSFSLAFFCLLF